MNDSKRVPKLTVRGASEPTGRVEEETRLRKPGGGAQATSARVHLVIGPVGAGKSTLALQLAEKHAAVRFALDDWMATLFRPDRPASGVVAWYVERAARCVEQIGTVARAIVQVETSVVLELGLLQASEREQFYARVAEAGVELTVYVVDAERDVRRERVRLRNEQRGPTFSMVVPPEVFELASDLWQPPSDDECRGRDVRFVFTDTAPSAGEDAVRSRT